MLKPALLALLLAPPLLAADLTLEKAMADPDWIGAPVEAAWWSADSTAAYYKVKHAGSPLRDLHRVNVATGQDAIVGPSDRAAADGPGVKARKEPVVAFVREGDVFLRDLRTGALTQATSTTLDEQAVGFMADPRYLRFRAGIDWFTYDRVQHIVKQVADLSLSKDPLADPEADDLRDRQLRLFTRLQRQRAESQEEMKDARDRQQKDPTRVGPTVYLGDDVEVVATDFSPSGRYLLFVTQPKGQDAGRVGKMPKYVTESGYEEIEDVRTRVGRNAPLPQSLRLADLTTGLVKPLSLDPLPGIKDDPLKALREAAQKDKKKSDDKPEDKKAEKKDDEPKARAVSVLDTAWNPSGTEIAIVLRASDNKDRWIATVDLEKAALVPRHRLSDAAWVNWGVSGIAWANDATLLFQSEQSGYAHLRALHLPDGADKALTSGAFEVSAPAVDAEGRFAYVVANRNRPIEYEAYRIDLTSGALTELTDLDGVESLALSPDGKNLLVTHSRPHVPPQLSVVDLATRKAKPLTDTRTAEYKAMTFPEPEFVEVPSSHQPRPIWSKLYLPKGEAPAGGRPAVLFIHGAGYTQDVYLRWPYYFREQFFNHLLVSQGYAVLVMDYRASEGYGRDWRTAIYRQMGYPELEDLQDGVAWLAKNHGVDPKRVGLYGGSYGGFLTLMGLFRFPGTFGAGAALRPVTDWSAYNQPYTAAILNTPEVDPEAYRVSSPIEFAPGLRDPLLIAHGMIDDNVFYQDSVRLTQRLIELGKENWELASYPLERHSFEYPESWLDEYRRIFKLFGRTIGRNP